MNTTYNEVLSLMKKYNMSIDDLKEYQEEQEKEEKMRQAEVIRYREELIGAIRNYKDALVEFYHMPEDWSESDESVPARRLLQEFEKTIAENKDTRIRVEILSDSDKTFDNSKKSAGSGDSRHKDADAILRKYFEKMGL